MTFLPSATLQPTGIGLVMSTRVDAACPPALGAPMLALGASRAAYSGNGAPSSQCLPLRCSLLPCFTLHVKHIAVPVLPALPCPPCRACYSIRALFSTASTLCHMQREQEMLHLLFVPCTLPSPVSADAVSIAFTLYFPCKT